MRSLHSYITTECGIEKCQIALVIGKIKTPRGLYIVKRAEKALLNERIRSVNNTINMLKMQIDTCKEQLKTCLEERVMEEGKLFINNKKESRHNCTLVRQLHEFE